VAGASSPREVMSLKGLIRPEHRERAKARRKLRVPTVQRAFTGLIVLLGLMFAATLYYVPWVQTAAGMGRVTALNPGDRLQTITALVDGRIKRWFVYEGSRVKAGDPIVEVEDIDPLFVSRLEAERQAIQEKYNAAQIASQTAIIDYQRQERLFKDGLAARSDFEAAKIKYKEFLAKEAAAKAEVNKADINLTQQSTRVVKAPRDGTVLGILAGDVATLVKQGEAVATFLPLDAARAVELYVSGLDAPLVYPGRRLRLQFDGWPAVQFSGWPATAIGTFGGIVQSVDPSAQADGRFRVLVVEDRNDPWPEQTYVRFGSQVKGWVLLNTVRLGYELWRRLNGFPPLRDETASHGGYPSTAAASSGSGASK
jgi:multidrug efflux pump subunit AcrA (membrane-fusion protein)